MAEWKVDHERRRSGVVGGVEGDMKNGRPPETGDRPCAANLGVNGSYHLFDVIGYAAREL